jgi:acid phosphatase
LSGYIAWAKNHNSLFILTWDEDSGHSGNHIVTILAGAGVPAKHCNQLFDHYGTLRLLEDLYDLPRLGKSKNAPALACLPWQSHIN